MTVLTYGARYTLPTYYIQSSSTHCLVEVGTDRYRQVQIGNTSGAGQVGQGRGCGVVLGGGCHAPIGAGRSPTIVHAFEAL